MLVLKTLDEAEKFVTRQKRLGADVRWDNYDIVFHRPDDRAVWSNDGEFRNGWGFKNVSAVTDDGTWEINYRNVRSAKRSAGHSKRPRD